MTFEEYQRESRKTALYPDLGKNIVYPTLGLTSEAGEVAGKVKKIFRDHGGVMSEEQKQAITKEMGDTLWYLAQLATECSVSLDDIAVQNLENVFARQQRGTIHGNGDNR
jgi:NTP pyrophosphatase (non-canonical NTP hydrolase)